MNTSKTPSSKPATLWKKGLAETIVHPPLIIGDILLVAAQSAGSQAKHCTLYALELSNGKVRWKHNFTYALVNGMQAYHLHAEQVDVAVVAMGSSDILRGEGRILALSQTGEVVWEWKGTSQQYSAPLVRDRQVFVTAGAKQLIIISPEEDGDVERRIPLGIRASLAAPSVKGGIAYIPCRAPELLAVELNGAVRWQFKTNTSKRDHLNKTPVVTTEMIFTVSDAGSLLALNRDSGSLEWQNNLGNGRSLSEPVLLDGILYVGSRYGLAAIEANNGKEVWQFKTTRSISGKPLVFPNIIFATCEDHFLYALDCATGKEMWFLEMERRIEMPPVLAPSALIVIDRGGNIVALERPFVQEVTPAITEVILLATEKQIEAKKAAAESYQENGYHEKAADTWHELGELEQAAEQYEAAEIWEKAAELWQQLDRYNKRAAAYQRYAEKVSDESVDDEIKAAAWELAARAFAETGQKNERIKCEKEVARYRRQPIIKMKINPKPLFLNTWSDFFVTVKNEGFGVARFVSVTPQSDRFESPDRKTLTTPTLIKNKDFEFWFSVKPREHGTRVPIKLMVEYKDKLDQVHKLDRTFYVKVDKESSLPITKPEDLSRIVPQTGQLAELDVPEGIDLVDLYHKILNVFNRDELSLVMFELNMRDDDYDSRLKYMTKQLLEDLARQKRLEELIEVLKKNRPNEEWD